MTLPYIYIFFAILAVRRQGGDGRGRGLQEEAAGGGEEAQGGRRQDEEVNSDTTRQADVVVPCNTI